MSEEVFKKTADGKIIYPLKVPLQDVENMITELHFRQPKLKHYKSLDNAKGDFAKLGNLIEKLCDIRPGLVDEIDAQDFEGIGKVFQFFSPAPPQT